MRTIAHGLPGAASRLVPLSHAVILAWGWRRWALAALAGAATTLALPPFDLWPVPFLTMPVLVWLVDGAAGGGWHGLRPAAAAGWWFGFGYFFAGLYWIGNAFLVDAKVFGWLLPFAVTALPAGLALFTAAAFVLARLIWPRGAARLLALALALTLAEWLRGHVLTGFPWNAFGYALMGPQSLAQGVSLVGLWGMTFVAVAVYASPAILADDPSDTRRPWMPLGVSVALLSGLAAFGAWRIAAHPTGFVAHVHLRLMQPNLQQDEKFNYGAKDSVMRRYLALSDRASGPHATGMADVTHLIWPESAFPFFLTREPDAMAQIAALLPPGTVLLTGAVRAAQLAPTAPLRAYNSLYAIGHDGSVLSIYDKVHLVPFGEYLPFQDTLERIGLMQLTELPGGFLAGERRRPMAIPNAPPAAPLICYEVIFPGEVADRAERPGWLLNVTNDAWFGLSPGPYQHFQQARIQAIAEGLPLVRAANDGISAVVDPVGRVVRSLPLGTEGVLDSGLPQPLPPTLYVKVGDGPVLLMLLLAGAMVLVRRPRRRAGAPA